DNQAADARMREKLGDPNWKRPKDFRWNHAGGPGSKTMELVDANTHRAMAHKGSAAEPRAAHARGATGRVMAALSVYLMARDVLQIAGVLKPDFAVDERETYHFREEDGSEYVIAKKWFSSPERHFVAGPKKGRTEKITTQEMEEHRKRAEEE